ncbi:MAG: 16S rRNA (guanine(966)-N(2))-methyltransferase RsmD [Pseudomonadota bacterium]
MRIVAGQHKGRPIGAPKGRGTRPTSDRAREALFNVLAHADWAPDLSGARVIDLFAGSGALGLEAISRGAVFCLFVETDHGARGAIRANIEAMGLYGITRLHRRSATDLGEKPAGVGAPFTLAFMDPPYGKGLVPPALNTLVKGQWLADDALVIVEMSADEDFETPERWKVLDDRSSGAARMVYLKSLSAQR